MGIQGLLPLLKSIMGSIHIKELEGCCVAVDTYSWLHKGALSCSLELCKGLPTSRHIEYCMHRVNLLRHYGVKPILVFDGGLLPMKSEQENKRARARKENLARAIEHEANGNSAAAFECYQKAVDISPSIAHELIQVLKKENIDHIVAPYEADAQMTFLAVTKHVDAVITEDSDLIPFGCPRIIYKMDKFGQGVEFRYTNLQNNKEVNLTGFTKQMILEMCVLSGCDYLPSLPGMGLKRAHALVKKLKSIPNVIKHLRFSNISIPPWYEESFQKAIWTFQYQRVYDPIVEDIVHLTDLSINIGDDLDFLGPSVPQNIAQGIARGELDPFTKMPFQKENSSHPGPVLGGIYQLKNFKIENERKKPDLPAQKNLLTNYFCFASLEAKRKFRVPRVTSKFTDPLDKSIPSPSQQASEEGASPKLSMEERLTSSSAEYLESSCDDGLNGIEDDTIPKHAVLQQFGQSLHKPCLILHKDPDCSYNSDAVGEKARIEKRRAIVRSSYFQPKIKEKMGEINNNDPTFKEEEKTMLENRKVVMSSYSQPKSVKENKFDKEIDISCENTASQDTSLWKRQLMKRKATAIGSIETENVNVNYTRTDASSLQNRSNCTPYLDDSSKETAIGKDKFGSNISHLGHYSVVAEKSMERFVSVISSFRFASAGSRASGLRAPLRDVKNTCTSRSTVAVDLSKFSYVTKNKKTASAVNRE